LNVYCHRTKYGEAKGNHRLGADEKLDIAGSKETALVRPSVSLRLVRHVLKVDDGTNTEKCITRSVPGQDNQLDDLSH
jgi:hypothetical protein